MSAAYAEPIHDDRARPLERSPVMFKKRLTV